MQEEEEELQQEEQEEADLLVLAGSGFWTALVPEGLLTSLVGCLGFEPA